MDDTRIQEVMFRKAVLEGTAYEVGKMQGEWIQNDPNTVRFFTSPLEGKDYPTAEEADRMLKFFDQYCRG